MYFNSYIFILAFLPITLWGYYLINKTKKYGFGQMWLLGASFVFVGYLNIYYVLIIMFSIVMGYLFISLVTKREISTRGKKGYLVAGIIIHTGILLYFK